MRRVLLFTGGLDSAMLWRKLGEPLCVYVAQPDSPYMQREIMTISTLQRIEPGLRVEVIEGGEWPGPEADGHVLHRNLGLIVQVAANTAAECIYIGSVRGESSPDKSRAFLRATSKALSTSEHHPISVKAPLRRHTKSWWLQDHLSRWPEDWPMLSATRSCYSGDGQRCGQCLACLRRWVAFTNAGVAPEDHASPPWLAFSRDWRVGVRYLTGTPVFEWPGMLANHRDALRAARTREAM